MSKADSGTRGARLANYLGVAIWQDLRKKIAYCDLVIDADH